MDKETIAQLFRQHYAQMLSLARCLLYDEEESRDIVSEVFASLLKPTMLIPTNIEGYLMTCVRNRCFDLLEHKDVQARFEQAYTQTLNDQTTAEEDDELLNGLMSFMQRELKPETLQVFKMRHIDGLKYQEIAERMGISRVMVYKHLSQATEQLKGYISKQR
jgi:RNA polymerase sigma-70 factor (ECF subfamily)